MADLVCFSAVPFEHQLELMQTLPPHPMRYRCQFFVEPATTSPRASVERIVSHAAMDARFTPVVVLRLELPGETVRRVPFDDAAVLPCYVRHLRAFFEQNGATDLMFWLYTPTASAFADAIPHRMLVYDVEYPIDLAPRERCETEKALIKRANLVLYRKHTDDDYPLPARVS